MEEGAAGRIRKSLARRVRLFAYQQLLVVEQAALQQRRSTILGKIESDLSDFVAELEAVLS